MFDKSISYIVNNIDIDISIRFRVFTFKQKIIWHYGVNRMLKLSAK